MPYLFVYGTLKKGCHNHHYLKNAVYIGEAVVEDYTLLGTLVPYAVEAPGCRVRGELYQISREDLEVVDQLEIPAGYMRIEVEAKTTRGVYTAWMYAYPKKFEKCAKTTYRC